MAVRVYAPEAKASGDRLALAPDEATHVARVLRLGVGDALRAFDGRGREWTATIASIGRTGVSIELQREVAPAAEPRTRYVLAPAVLKGDGTDGVVRDAVMMGVSRIRPHVSARSDVTAAALTRGGRQARWQRVAVASAKQCGRAVVPEVDAVVRFLALVADDLEGLKALLVEPAAAATVVRLHELAPPTTVTLAIGPEGGWTIEEVAQALHAGWIAVTLGARTLRATATPLAAMAACQAVWRDG